MVTGAGSKRKLDSTDQDDGSKKPSKPYDTVSSLGDLTPGPKRIGFDARIVNIYDQSNIYFDDSTENTGRSTKKKKPSKESGGMGAGQQARGCLKIILKDDMGCILVKLWYADTTYDLHLGKLVSIWTTHISPFKQQPKNPGKADTASTPTSPPIQLKDCPLKLMTSIFPERDNGCGIKIHERGDIGIIGRIPLGYKFPFALDSLVDAPEKHAVGKPTKVLVYVYAIGPVRESTNSNKQIVPTIDIGVTDGHSKACVGLYGEAMRSAMKWIPNSTVLLISNASWKPGSRLYMTSLTFIEVDPDIIEAEELKKLATRTAVHVNPPFPTDLFDVEEFESSIQKIKFTLADVDELASSTRTDFMGYASVVLLDINLAALYKQNCLFCAECCTVPIFSNYKAASCGQCEAEVKLRLNPQIVGSIVDETGMISCFPPMFNHATGSDARLSVAGQTTKVNHMKRKGTSPLLWSADAMHQLLGCDIADILIDHDDESAEILISLRLLEARLMYSRIILLFGWCSTDQKMAICKVIK
ncbi:hypothetical protein McanMca71_001804 [Microsporum canis]